MRCRFFLSPVVAVALLVVGGAPRLAAQNSWVLEALEQYNAHKYEEVTPRLVRLSDLRVFYADLEKLSPTWLNAKVRPIVPARHVLVSFALEAAASHLSQADAAQKLLEWACKLVQLDAQPDEFDRRWDSASLSLFEGVLLPKALETHAGHIAQQFPNEPRLLFARALVDEQRTAPFIHGEDKLEPVFDSAAQKYRLAAAVPELTAEANLHLGYTEFRRGRFNAAVAALQQVEPHTNDRGFVYLAGLFGGQALEGLGHTSDAEAAYRAALAIVPSAHSATTALIAALYRSGRQADANALAMDLLTRPGALRDPWWDYWPGDFRWANERIAALREILK